MHPSWMNFFTMMPLNPSTFNWAKLFLHSSAWSFLAPSTDGNVISFSHPNSCPLTNIPELTYLSSHFVSFCEIADDILESASLSPPPPSPSASQRQKRSPAKKNTEPIVCSYEVMRSLWVYNKSKGFKSTSFKDQHYMGCSAHPPTISPVVIRDLWDFLLQHQPRGVNWRASQCQAQDPEIGDQEEELQ